MPVRELIGRGIGFSPGSVRFIPTLGLGAGGVPVSPQTGSGQQAYAPEWWLPRERLPAARRKRRQRELEELVLLEVL